jgi:VWFA-related protein
VILLAVSLCGSGLAAQQTPGPFMDTIDVNVVNVEVMVTDREGMPVTDLGPESFTLWEDGEQVELTNFFAVTGKQVLPPETANDELTIRPTPDTQRLQLVLLVDELNIRPENRNRMLDELRDYLTQRRDAGDLMMLVRTGDQIVVEQAFTDDTDLVLEAIGRMEKRVGRHAGFDIEYRSLIRRIRQASLAGPQPLNPYVLEAALIDAERLGDEIRVVAAQRFRNVIATVDQLKRFTRTLAGGRGRKGILYVSDGMPARAAEALVAAWQGKFEAWLRANDRAQVASRLVSVNSLEFDTSRVLRELVEEANANRVAFYTISNNNRRARASLSAEFRGDTSLSGAGPTSLALTDLESGALDESLLQLAKGTGGLAFTNSSNIGGLVDRMRTDFGSFYSLGYMRRSGEDREYHRIEVKVADPRLLVRHLEGFRLRDAYTHLRDLTLSALHHDLEHNPLDVRLDPGEQTPAEKGRFVVSVTVSIPFRKLLLIPEQDSHVAHVTLVVVARDEAGGVSQPQRIEMPIRVPNERILDTADGRAAYPLQLEMKPGLKRISVGVRDQLARIDSTLSLALEVGSRAAAAIPPEAWIWRRTDRGAASAERIAAR